MDFDAVRRASEPMRRAQAAADRMNDLLRGPANHVHALQQQQEEHQRSMEEATTHTREANRRNAEQQAERDELQRANVRLLKEAAERDHARDVQAKADSEAERARKRWELYRWAFTTLIALAGMTIAIIGLVTR